jgi:hypothetical protein
MIREAFTDQLGVEAVAQPQLAAHQPHILDRTGQAVGRHPIFRIEQGTTSPVHSTRVLTHRMPLALVLPSTLSSWCLPLKRTRLALPTSSRLAAP